jgi:hypothetical protein
LIEGLPIVGLEGLSPARAVSIEEQPQRGADGVRAKPNVRRSKLGRGDLDRGVAGGAMSCT